MIAIIDYTLPVTVHVDLKTREVVRVVPLDDFIERGKAVQVVDYATDSDSVEDLNEHDTNLAYEIAENDDWPSWR